MGGAHPDELNVVEVLARGLVLLVHHVLHLDPHSPLRNVGAGAPLQGLLANIISGRQVHGVWT